MKGNELSRSILSEMQATGPSNLPCTLSSALWIVQWEVYFNKPAVCIYPVVSRFICASQWAFWSITKITYSTTNVSYLKDNCFFFCKTPDYVQWQGPLYNPPHKWEPTFVSLSLLNLCWNANTNKPTTDTLVSARADVQDIWLLA